MMVLSVFPRLCLTSSTKGAKVSSIEDDFCVTEYLILGLLGDSDTITGLLIPRTRQIALRELCFAVAVKAITLTFSASKLLTSPK